MKGIVKATGEVINIARTKEVETKKGKRMVHITSSGCCYGIDEVDVFPDDFSYWRNFRNNIASNMLPVTSEWHLTKKDAKISISKEAAVKMAIEYADALIEELQKTQFNKIPSVVSSPSSTTEEGVESINDEVNNLN